VIGVGLITPDAALGVAPGVIVKVQVVLDAISPQLAGLMLLPDGNAGDRV